MFSIESHILKSYLFLNRIFINLGAWVVFWDWPMTSRQETVLPCQFESVRICSNKLFGPYFPITVSIFFPLLRFAPDVSFVFRYLEISSRDRTDCPSEKLVYKFSFIKMKLSFSVWSRLHSRTSQPQGWMSRDVILSHFFWKKVRE